jgi:hypothetical protein
MSDINLVKYTIVTISIGSDIVNRCCSESYEVTFNIEISCWKHPIINVLIPSICVLCPRDVLAIGKLLNSIIAFSSCRFYRNSSNSNPSASSQDLGGHYSLACAEVNVLDNKHGIESLVDGHRSEYNRHDLRLPYSRHKHSEKGIFHYNHVESREPTSLFPPPSLISLFQGYQ